ncbi:hypothetical protein CJ030_MR1G027810 [Morella rubra]|uniref:Uncharacterized protein n=1 Tax=Morella rubra TaxID=262757 RepID=A0A6A1VI63_9ROSI|nr:hypothetical protein CJ030_MR5G003798 [Morella rubra]KAB1226161.1 hypothetical protein CJ030_MR1G027810 [Morella rubra]
MMKTVSGKILSWKPVSLKKATSILSTFASTDNGASPAICAYLRRARASFKELRHVEKEIGAPRSGRKHKRPKPEIVSDGEGVQENQNRSVEVSQAPSQKQKSYRLDSNISRNGISKDEKPSQIVDSGQEKTPRLGINVGEEDKRSKKKRRRKTD